VYRGVCKGSGGNDQAVPRAWIKQVISIAKMKDTVDRSITLSYTFCMRKEIDKIQVEWDENKEKINIRKHGISFDTAALVFADEERIEYYDKLHSSAEEDRYVVLGMVEDVLFVVYTDRLDTVRLISARVATAYERRVYYGDN